MNGQSFFNELQKLLLNHPKKEAQAIHSQNCDHCNYVYDSKNLAYSFDSYRSENSAWIFDSVLCNDCVDCDYTVEADGCYECNESFKSYNCKYIDHADLMTDCSFCYDCSNLTDCFGCVGLSNKSFCVFNRQLSKQEYEVALKKYNTYAPDRILAEIERMKVSFPIRPNWSGHNTNCPYGNYIYYSKNCYWCFDAAHNEDCGYMYNSSESKVSYDCTYAGRYNENSYQLIESARMNNCSFTIDSNAGQDCGFIFDCDNIKNCFGCVGLRHKQWCILNRQLTKQQYESMIAKIQRMVYATNGWEVLRY
jgi:hypothetical protein